MTKICEWCKKSFERPFRSGKDGFKISWGNFAKSRFCGIKCSAQYRGSIHCGVKNPNYKGGTVVNGHSVFKCKTSNCNNYTARQGHECRNCWKMRVKTHENSSCWKGGMPKCPICKNKLGDRNSRLCSKCCRGAFRPAWRGGISSINSLIRVTPQNRKWVMSVFYRDKFICQQCGSTKNLNAHHIKSFAQIIKENNIKSIEDAVGCAELWNIENGLTLCKPCHKKTDTYATRS